MLTDRQQFKVAYIEACAERGLTKSEILSTIQVATEQLEKKANVLKDTASVTKDYLSWALPLALAAPPIIGLGGGTLLAHLTDPGEEDTESIKNRELIDEYRRASEQLSLANQAKKLRKTYSRSGRPLI